MTEYMFSRFIISIKRKDSVVVQIIPETEFNFMCGDQLKIVEHQHNMTI